MVDSIMKNPIAGAGYNIRFEWVVEPNTYIFRVYVQNSKSWPIPTGPDAPPFNLYQEIKWSNYPKTNMRHTKTYAPQPDQLVNEYLLGSDPGSGGITYRTETWGFWNGPNPYNTSDYPQYTGHENEFPTTIVPPEYPRILVGTYYSDVKWTLYD